MKTNEKQKQEKQEWYGLTPAQREELILELLKQGYTANDLNEYFDVKTKRVINDFMNARGYSKRNNTYIPKQIKEREYMAANPIIQQQNNMLPNIQIDEETIVNVLTLSKQADKIQEIINLYENGSLIALDKEIDNKMTKEPQQSYIEIIDTSMPIQKIEGEIKRTTLRINETIMAEFNQLWKDKYSEYKQHDLLAIALRDFIDKYK